jgi:hypothetical protein
MSQIERAQKIYCVGDSHSLPLRDIVYRSSIEATPFLVTAHYISGFSAPEMIGVDGDVGPKMQHALKSLDLLGDDGGNAWTGFDQAALNVSFAAGVPAAAPLLVIFCGDIDLRGSIFRQFNNSFDFKDPDGTSITPPGVTIVPHGDVDRLLTAKFSAIIQGIKSLKAIGFPRTYLAMITPPSLEDEAEFESLHGFPCPLALRKRLTRAANQVLSRLCAAAAIPFVDVRDLVEEKGLLASEFRLDGFHMSTEGAIKVVDAVLDHAVLNSAAYFNKQLYEHARNHAEPATLHAAPAFAKARDEFNQNGVFSRTIDIAPIMAALNGREYGEDVGNNHLRLSWCGNGRKPFNPKMRNLIPDQMLLSAVHEVVYSDASLPYFQAALGADPHFINTRFFMSLPHDDAPEGPQTFHLDGCPPGVIRALIYLIDVDIDNGPFEYIDENKKHHFATGPTGTLLVFDANRRLHRGSPPRMKPRKAIDFCVAPRPATFPRRVMWAGMNNWPVDPYQFAVDGMVAYPPLERGWVRVYPFASRS